MATGKPSFGAAGERGAALLESMIALLVLLSAGVSVVAVLGAVLREEVALRARERTAAAADRVLAATTLLTRDELDQRLGQRRIGEFVVRVERPTRTLYRIAVAADTGAAELLVTVVQRPDSVPGLRP